MKFLHLLWRNLFRRKVRTTFTFLSIVVAFFLFGILMAIRHGFDYGVQIAGESRLLTIHKISIIQLLPIRYQSRAEVVVERMTIPSDVRKSAETAQYPSIRAQKPTPQIGNA